VSPTPDVRFATRAAIAEAARRIRDGVLVAFPTETVYGLGADAWNDRAVARVFEAKGRPSFNPLIVHVPDSAAAEVDVDVDDRARRLMDAFWPGPLTLVLSRRATSRLSRLVSAGLDTVAIRAPDHPVALALLHDAGRPIAAPSANPSGAISATSAADVARGLGDCVPLILDGGSCPIGVESTVVDLTRPEPAILRPGGVTAEELEALLGPLARPAEGPLTSPGQLSRHYAPRHPLRLDALCAGEGEVLLGFGPASPADVLNLSSSGDLREAAANLFAMLHRLDRLAPRGIAVMPIPEMGLGRAINDRLRRASAPPPNATPDDSQRDRNHWDDERGPSLPCVLPDISDDGE
jgi:L-threonylcarbamoyladenylate synthase